MNFSFKFPLRCHQSNIVSIICPRYTGGKFPAVVDTGGNLLPVSLSPVANLPPVSTTPVVPGAKFSANVVDICGAPLLVNISENF
jgi:hypothetical protein